MKIRTRLYLMASAPFILLALLGLASLFTYRNLHDAYQTNRVAQRIESQAFDLGMLGFDYVISKGERARTQWQRQHHQLSRSLEEADRIEYARATIARIRARHREIGALFSALVRHQMQVPEQESATLDVWQSRLTAQLLIASEAIFTNAKVLDERSAERITREQNLLVLSSLSGFVLAGVLVGTLSLWTARSVTDSLRRLRRAASRLAAGQLDFRADTKSRDEHGELADALNEMAAKLASTQQQLLQSEKLSALGTLAAGVAHELNNPMTGVLTYVDYARIKQRDPEVERVLSRAKRELERMRDLLKNMLTFARPVEEKLRVVSVESVLRRALDLLAPQLKESDIRVVTDFGADLPEVPAKPGHLQQVFVNLLLNARDAMVDSPERIMTISAYGCSDALCIVFNDTGHGIPPELAHRIFDPFFTTKPVGKGTGLGLPVAQNIVSDLGGTISCASTVGKGATFTVRLPLGSPGTEAASKSEADHG